MAKNKPRRNYRSTSSAAAQAGVIGLPDPVLFQRGEGDLFEWCKHEFAPAFDRFAECRPEMRARHHHREQRAG